jgi:CrcB protein
MVKTLLLIALGGGVGSACRYLTSLATAKFFSGTFPLATFVVNSIGCFIIGITMGYLERNSALDPNIKFLVITGFCGGYTTFSAFGLENLQLLQQQQYGWAFLNIAASVLVGIAAVGLGWLCSK